jgi:replication factor C subunit 3/5
MFLIDKYEPKNRYEIKFHHDIYKLLEVISQHESIPHIIISGPTESGKKTLINIFLKMIFDDSVLKTKPTSYFVSGSGSNANKEIIIKQSSYHIVIDPSNNNSDFYLIQCVVKQFASISPLKIFETKRDFKVVLINKIDTLSKSAQASLRRTIERYSKTCRFIMWCRSSSQVIDSLRSRCFCINVPAPSEKELLGLVANVAQQEKIPMEIEDYINILDRSQGRVKTALWMLQFKQLKQEYVTSYDLIIDDIIKILLSDKMERLKNIRKLIYNIIITNIKGTEIIKSIVNKLITKIKKEKLLCNIIAEAAKFEHRLTLGRREIFHLEGFINTVYAMVHL